MNLVDSCGWLAYFADGANAGFFAPAIEDVEHLIVPSICVLEVFRRVLQQRDENDAIHAAALMRQGELVAMDAARLGVQHGLPLAGSIILATAQAHSATVWTQDADFKGLPGVEYVEKS